MDQTFSIALSGPTDHTKISGVRVLFNSGLDALTHVTCSTVLLNTHWRWSMIRVLVSSQSRLAK